MNLSEIKTLIETNTIQELEEKEKALLLVIENKNETGRIKCYHKK